MSQRLKFSTHILCVLLSRASLVAMILAAPSSVVAQTASDNTAKPPDEDPEVRPPVTKADLKIIQRAREILDSPSKWNRADTRDCPAEAQTFSLYCALEKATDEVSGNFKHRGAAMQEARFVVDEIAPNRKNYEHRLMDYNNDPTTTFGDIQKVLGLAEARIAKRLIEESPRAQTEGTTTIAEAVPQICPVTLPPGKPFVPPSPYPSEVSPDGFWFGSEKLWIQLPKNGTWGHLPHYEPTDTSFRQKLQWWREGYDWRKENPPQLTVTGKRLDSASSPLRTDDHANAAGLRDHSSMMSGVFFPTLGCWQVTGDYKGDKLTFVIWVTP